MLTASGRKVTAAAAATMAISALVGDDPASFLVYVSAHGGVGMGCKQVFSGRNRF